MIKIPHTLLVYAISPGRIFSSREILTSYLAHSLVTPCPYILLATTIRGDFHMIPFLILVGIFFFSGTTSNTLTDSILVFFKPVMQLKKLSPVHTLCLSPCIFLGARKNEPKTLGGNKFTYTYRFFKYHA
jgi:hypothetical protein